MIISRVCLKLLILETFLLSILINKMSESKDGFYVVTANYYKPNALTPLKSFRNMGFAKRPNLYVCRFDFIKPSDF